MHIELDNREAVFQPGDTVRGQLTLNLATEQHPRNISLHAIGTEFTTWGTQPVYIARTHSLDETHEVWKPAREGDGLPAGRHTFPFAVELPAHLPPSFDGMLTQIGYGLKAKVDLPRHIDLHAEAGLIVLAVTAPLTDEPVSNEAHDASGHRLSLTLPRSVYRLGETVDGTLHLTQPGDGRLRRLIVELVSRERGSAQGVWEEYAECEADLHIELERITQDGEFPFTFRVPDSAAPTFSGEHSRLTWHVSARLDITRATDLVAEVTLTVVEPE